MLNHLVKRFVLFCCIVNSIVGYSQFASSGPGSSGGGDTDAVEFLVLAKNIHRWIQQEGASLVPVPPQQWETELSDIVASLDGQRQPRLIFTDCDILVKGVPKMARFEDGVITVNRPNWKVSDKSTRYGIVALEMYGVMKVSLRYEQSRVISQNAEHIEKIAQAWGLQAQIKTVLYTCDTQTGVPEANLYAQFVFNDLTDKTVKITGKLPLEACQAKAQEEEALPFHQKFGQSFYCAVHPGGVAASLYVQFLTPDFSYKSFKVVEVLEKSKCLEMAAQKTAQARGAK